jgi:hypothetical protein
MAESINDLQKEIREALSGRPYPGDDRIALHRPGCPGYEGETVSRFFRGKDWREITLDSILSDPELDRNAFMSFMTAEGFVYYLPAFLLLSLDVDGPFALGEPLAFKLTPPAEEASEGWKRHFSQIVSSLAPREKRAVAHVLQYLAHEYERRGYVHYQAQAALNSYWAHLPE